VPPERGSSGKREQIERAIRAFVTQAMTEGQPVDVTALAIALSSEYPQSGFTLDAICEQIGAVVARGRDELPPIAAG